MRSGAAGEWLLQKRPAAGLLAGLWQPPAFEGVRLDGPQAVRQALAGLGLDPGGNQPSPLPAARHIFSHVEWQMTGWLADVPAQDAPEGCVWTGAGGLEGRYALPGAFKAYRPFLFG